jgi:hypothetical protein
VRHDLWRVSGSLSDDAVDRGIHAALRRVESERRWHWLEEVHAGLTAESDSAIMRRPASLKSISSLSYVHGSNAMELLSPAPLAVVRAWAQSAGKGGPRMYHLAHDAIYLDCPVSMGDTFDLVFKAGTPPILESAMADPPVTLTLHLETVVAWACSHVALVRLKNEREAQRHSAAYAALLETMMNEEDEARSDEMGSGIVPDNGLYRSAHGRWTR